MSRTKLVFFGGSKGGVGKCATSHLACLGAILCNQPAAYVLTDPDSFTVAAIRRLEVSGDPDDNRFLECADAGRADYMVTGNLRHFPRFWKKTKIITPREFIGIVAPHLIT
jgi:predicted nucleic acid-binding protein